MARILSAQKVPVKGRATRMLGESGGLGVGWDVQRDRWRAGAWRTAADRHSRGRAPPCRRCRTPWQCLPGNALIELERRCGLRPSVPVRQRFAQLIPGGRSAGRGDPWWLVGLAEVPQDALDWLSRGDEGDQAQRRTVGTAAGRWRTAVRAGSPSGNGRCARPVRTRRDSSRALARRSRSRRARRR